MRFVEFFAGVGGFRLGLEQAGHECVAACEIDEDAREVYAARFGAPPEFSDIGMVQPHDIPTAELWCGGFPCQDVSIAGNGRGIEVGTRSGLWLEWLRLVTACRPAWLLIENVPGLLTNRRGADFRTVIGSLDELGYVGAWRVLDARFFGVPQRRRRVFIVACRAGVGDPAAVLFEREGVRGDLAASIATGADVARRLTVGSGGSSRYDGDTETFVTSVNVARPLKAKANDSHDESHDTYVVQCHGSNVGPMGALRVGNGNVTGGVPFVADVPAVAGTLGGGSGKRGWHDDLDRSGAFVPYVKTHRATSESDAEIWRPNDVAPTLREGDCRDVRTPVAIAFSSKDHSADAGPISPTLRAGGHRDSHANGGAPPAVAFSFNAFAESGNGGNGYTENGTPPVRGSNSPATGSAGVRRLTPTECERLQGFPDGWTCLCGAAPYSTAACVCKDGYRYKQMGNAVAVPVIEWIGRRLRQG